MICKGHTLIIASVEFYGPYQTIMEVTFPFHFKFTLAVPFSTLVFSVKCVYSVS